MNIEKGKTQKVIKIILRKKFSNFVRTIKDEKVRELVKENSIITGGSIANLLLGEPVNDYDIYFTNQETVEAVAHYYLNEMYPEGQSEQVKVVVEGERVKIHIQSDGVAGDVPEEAEDSTESLALPNLEECPVDEDGSAVLNVEHKPEEYKPVFISANAITLSDQVQLILRFYGDVEEIHKNYDFVHCTNAWESRNGKLHLRTDAMAALMSRELKYIGSRYPVCSVIRTRKFIKRGFSCNAGQYLKMLMQANELDLTDIDVLEDQLTGVDATYFRMAIEVCRRKFPDGVVQSSYLFELLDRIF
jgi:hypothetical protein